MMPTLPLEVILLIVSHLEKRDWFPLLTINRQWFYAIASQLYAHVTICNAQDLKVYLNLFRETRRRRRSASSHGFYSTVNYGQFVRCLDISRRLVRHRDTDRWVITNDDLWNLALDCPRLETLNIYNCYTITSSGLRRVLEKCPDIRRLYISMATQLDARCLFRPERLVVLNICFIPRFFCHLNIHEVHALRDSFPSLQTLKIGLLWLARGVRYQDLAKCFQSIIHLHIEHTLDPEQVTSFLTCCTALVSFVCHHCKLTSDALRHLPPSLTELRIESCSSPMWHALTSFPRYTHLTTLSLEALRLTSTEMIDIVNQCSHQLRCFESARSMSDQALEVLVQRCPHLTQLGLMGGVISATCLRRTVEAYLHCLTDLRVAKHVTLTEDGTDCLPPNRRLEVLFFNCQAPVPSDLSERFPSLRILSLYEPYPHLDQFQHLEAFNFTNGQSVGNLLTMPNSAKELRFIYWMVKDCIW